MIACGSPGLKQPDMRVVSRNVLVNASGDAGAIQKLLQGSVINGGLWFADPACAAQFPNAAKLEPSNFAAFARCLAGLHLQASTREAGLGDVAVMTYAPGFEVEARVVGEASGPRLQWIGFASRRLDDNAPTITSEAFEGLRLTGDRNGPLDPDVAGELARNLDLRAKNRAAFTWMRVCIDVSGAVVDAHPFETTSPRASEAFSAAARTWTFRPFTIGARAVPVCSMARMASPPLRTLERLPLPPPPSRGKKEPVVFAEGAMRKFTEGKRIAGSSMLVPDEATRDAIISAHDTHVMSTFRVCIDETGHVESVLPTLSTGYAAYDRKIMAEIANWVYTAFEIDNQPVPICTQVRFIYSVH